MLQDGMLFKGNKLCIPRGFMRDNLLKEKHCGSPARHLGKDKTYLQLRKYYYWPKM